MTNVELDFLTDIDQNLFIEEEIRGEVTIISHRYSRVNAAGMERYDASKRNSYIMYVDANNLYGRAMSQFLQTSNFKWLTDEEMEDSGVIMIPGDSSRGYILECDLGNYHFYYVYIYVYFIKCNVFFLYISEYSHNFIKSNISFLRISDNSHELYDLHKDLHKDYVLAPERLQIVENIPSDYQRHLLQNEGFSKPPQR